MNFRTTYILFGVLGGLVILLGVVLVLTPTKPPDTKYVLPSLHNEADPVTADAVDTVTIEHFKPEAQKKIVLKRDETTKRWKMAEPLSLDSARVDNSLVDRLVNQVINARVEDQADTQGALDQYGLKEPAGKVTIAKGDKSWEIALGNKLETKGGQTSVQYVTSTDRSQAAAVRLSGLDLLNKSPYELRSKELLADNADEIRRVTLMDGTHTPLILKRDGATQWRYEQPAEYGSAEYQADTALPPTAPLPTKSIAGVKALLDILAAFKVEVKSETKDGKTTVTHDFVSEDARNLEQYGLTGDKLLRIKVTRAFGGGAGKESEVEKTLVIGKPVDEKGEKVYAMLEGENHVVKVSAANLELIRKLLDNPGALRNRDLAALSEPNIDAVKITAPGNDLELFRTAANKWKLYRKDKADDADAIAVGDLLRALTAKGQVKEFPDPKSADLKALQLDTPVATISVWEQGIKKEEKKDEKKEGDDKKPEPEKKDAKPTLAEPEKPTVKFLLGKRENGFVYVKRETKEGSTLMTVPDTIMDLVNKPAVAYLDKSIPPFTGDATKITLARGGEQFTLDKDKEAWKITAPKELEGKPANALIVSSIQSAMQFLRPEKIVAEKATPELEEQYGLKTPLTWVNLSTGGEKPEERTYLFGKEEGDSVYFKIKDREPIYLVKKFSTNVLTSELRDTTLFSFDRNNVQEMKVEGWSGLFPGNWQTIVLERKSATDWKVKSTTAAAPISNLDSKKAEDFLNYVLRQRVDKFIGKGGPQPTKMELNEDVLLIELTVSGEKELITLRVGGETPDQKAWFAKSSVLPGEFFTLAKLDSLPKDQTNDQFAKIRSQTPTQFFSAAPK